MFFVARRITAQLAFTKPLDCCCNCGSTGHVDLVETPLQRTRFFLVFGTELMLREEFPYCPACRRSATRVRPGLLARALMAALATAVVLVLLEMAESVLPKTMRESPFHWSVALGVVLTVVYFTVRTRRGKVRSYYQPVRLADVTLGFGRLQRLRLEFRNVTYSRLFARANADEVKAGVLQVDAAA